MVAPTKPQEDTRPEQAKRVADFLEKNPASTQKEIDAVCDTGCISKVLSDMPELGYGLSRAWREVPCAGGRRERGGRARSSHSVSSGRARGGRVWIATELEYGSARGRQSWQAGLGQPPRSVGWRKDCSRNGILRDLGALSHQVQQLLSRHHAERPTGRRGACFRDRWHQRSGSP